MLDQIDHKLLMSPNRIALDEEKSSEIDGLKISICQPEESSSTSKSDPDCASFKQLISTTKITN